MLLEFARDVCGLTAVENASLFQPELSSDPTWVHPLIAAFAAAVRAHAAAPLAGAVMT